MTHLLVTNDFPPKVGGIQVYLWELWRRMDPATFAVLTASSDTGAAAFDVEQASRGVRIDRVRDRVLLPTPQLIHRINQAADACDADLVLLDPAFPLGLVCPHLKRPSGVILHGAEVTVPGRLPGTRHLLNRALVHSSVIVSAGQYAADEAQHSLGSRALPPVVVIPPGVDLERFAPIDDDTKLDVRRRLGLPETGPLVVSVSRLVPRKGMDVLIDAAARLRHDLEGLTVVIAGRGRDADRLQRRAQETGAPVVLLGSVSDEDLPLLVGAADVFVMLCRNRWMGLEQEGFGIVFLEAAACGVPQVAGRSGGAEEAVLDGETGVLVDDPSDPEQAASAIRSLLDDPERRRQMGVSARRRAEASFDYNVLAPRLAQSLAGVGH